MKKAFKILSKIMLALSVIVYGVSLLIPGITKDTIDITYQTYFLTNIASIVCAIVGAILIYSSKETAYRVGNGLTIASFVIGLSTALTFINIEISSPTTVETVSSTAAIFMILATALLALYYVCQIVLIILNRGATEAGSPSEDLRVVRIKEWKQILDEGIITQEEYEEKRIQILGLKPKQTK